MKLSNRLLFLFCSLYFTQFCIGKSVFPARGFSSILDESEANKRLNKFRQIFFTDHKNIPFHRGYIYQFQFIHYPRSGQPIIEYGLLSGPSPESSKIRIDLLPSIHSSEPNASFLLVRDPQSPKAWKWQKEKTSIGTLHPKDWVSPWKEGVNHTPFDLLMPFLNWPSEYEKSGRVCGRPAHLYIFTTPKVNQLYPDTIKSVRLAIDDAYDAPLRIEYRDGGILPNRTFSLQSFKKVDGRWIVKAIDSKDRDSGSRTRFELQAVAHGLDLPRSVFQTDGLSQSINQSSISFTSL